MFASWLVLLMDHTNKCKTPEFVTGNIHSQFPAGINLCNKIAADAFIAQKQARFALSARVRTPEVTRWL
jgi:hypothetical protein